MLLLSPPLDSRATHAQTVSYTHHTDYAKMFPHVFSRQGPAGRKIALTFDDGPDLVYTPKILKILRDEHVHATFFVLGVNAAQYPAVVRQIVRDGNVLGNHSYDHKNLVKTSKNVLIWELSATDKVLVRITGQSSRWFRPPYGNVNPMILSQLAHMGYRAVNWSVDSNDWRSLSASAVKQNILRATRPGAIILQHCAGNPKENLTGTVRALPEIIHILRGKGYRFVTIPELLAPDSALVHANPSGAQRKN